MFDRHVVRWILGRNRSNNAKAPKLKVISNDFIGDEIMAYGMYEAKEIKLISTIFDFDTKNYNALDIGANIGNHTVFLSELFNKVLAFEPLTLARQLLIINTSGVENVTVFPFGLSDMSGKKLLSFSERNYGKASLNENQEYSEEIEIKKGDDIVDIPISFIKIDIEGHELMALSGLKETIKETLPIIAFEYNPEVENQAGLLEFLEHLGYMDFYIPSRISFFSKHNKNRFYQVILDDMIFNSASRLEPLNKKSKKFQNLVFTEAPSSKFRIKTGVIKP